MVLSQGPGERGKRNCLLSWHDPPQGVKSFRVAGQPPSTAPQILDLLRRASDHYRKREIEPAAELMKQVVALDPRNPVYLNDLAILHAAKREPVEAEAWYRRAIALRPGFAAAHLNLGNALRDQGRWDEAVEAYRQAAQLQVDLQDVHHALGTALRVVGRVDEAIASYQTALRLRPNSAELCNDVGNAFVRQGDLAKAIEFFQRAIHLRPDYAKPYRNLGSLLLQMGQFEQAAQALLVLEKMEPDDAKTHYELGTALARSGRQPEAIERLRRAVALDPSLAGAWCNLGLVLEEQGLCGEATVALAEARRLLPQSPVVAYHSAALGAGAAPPACPPEYLVELFDGYADRFDDHLFNRLNYRGPQLMLEAVNAVEHPPLMDVIDLGCGTGAAGPLFRPLARGLVGVDLAPRMLDQARKRGVYDELREEQIAAVLRSRPSSFDLAIAGDVFIYIGDLREVFAAARIALRPGGLFAFTIETIDTGDYVLRPSRRYAQSLAYVRRMAGESGFDEVRASPITIRAGEGPAVQGAVVVLRRVRSSRHSSTFPAEASPD